MQTPWIQIVAGTSMLVLLAACAGEAGFHPDDAPAIEATGGTPGGASTSSGATGAAGTRIKTTTGAVTGTSTGTTTGTITGTISGTVTGTLTGTTTGAVTGSATGTTTGGDTGGTSVRPPPLTVPVANNGFATGDGVEGYWYTTGDFVDGGTSTISPACPDPCFAASGRSICVFGEGAEVQNGDYSLYWGAIVGWNLNQAEDPDTTGTVNLTRYTMVTVGLSCNMDSPLRLLLDLDNGTHYCTPIMCGTSVLDLPGSFLNECWEGGEQTPLDRQLLRAVRGIQIQVTTTVSEPTPFDFCVTEVSFQP
jgi:hypothetical protein